jgi:hypothetical protein
LDHLVELVHHYGVNIRHLAHVRMALLAIKEVDQQKYADNQELMQSTDDAIAYVSCEMLARATKNLYRTEIRNGCNRARNASAPDAAGQSFTKQSTAITIAVFNKLLSNDTDFMQAGVGNELRRTFSIVNSRGQTNTLAAAQLLSSCNQALYIYRFCEVAHINLSSVFFHDCFPSISATASQRTCLVSRTPLKPMLACSELAKITTCQKEEFCVSIGVRTYSTVFRLKGEQFKAAAVKLANVDTEALV